MSGWLVDGTMAAALLTSAPSNTAAPTQAEITAGTDLVGSSTTEELLTVDGFRVNVETVPAGGLSSLIQGSLTGPSTFQASSMTWRADDTSTTIFTAVAESATTQYILLMPQGQSSGNRSYHFPVTIDNLDEPITPGVPHTFVASFSVAGRTRGTQAA